MKKKIENVSRLCTESTFAFAGFIFHFLMSYLRQQIYVKATKALAFFRLSENANIFRKNQRYNIFH